MADSRFGPSQWETLANPAIDYDQDKTGFAFSEELDFGPISDCKLAEVCLISKWYY